MHVIAPFLMLLLQTPPNDGPAVQLRASTSQPYIGQEVVITLDISGITGTAELAIPWRTREFGFNWSVSPADWLRGHSAKPGLTIHLPAEKTSIQAEEVPPGSPSGRSGRLQWRLIVNEPDTLNRGPIVFAPVRLKIGQK